MKLTGLEFEDQVFAVLAAACAYKRDKVRLWQTPHSGDGGKDIIVEASVPIDLLGLQVVPRRDEGMRVYIECKATERGRLRLETFAKNFLQTRKDSFDYFVLVTNGSITPHAFHVISEGFKESGVSFLVADDYFVRRALANECPTASEGSPAAVPDPVVVEYQYERHLCSGSAAIEVFLWFRNYSDQVRPCRLFLRSDRNWIAEETNESDITLYLEPKSGQSVRLRARKELYDGREDLELGLELDGESASLTVPGSSISLDFVPRLFGAEHHAIVRDLVEVLDRNSPFVVVSLTGEAGTGKSRVIEEVIGKRGSGDVKFFRVHFERGDPHRAVQRLLGLVDRELNTGFSDRLARDSPGLAIRRLLEDLNSPFFAVVLVLEDLHHADAGIIDALKAAVRVDRGDASPLCVILTGRSDFTFPNEHYFSLLELLGLENSGPHTELYEVHPLSDQDTRDLIRSTIENIPATALDRIHGMSMNVPFNVTQVIEYLLETELVRIKNRNTVGILNVQRFSSKRGIPDTMQEIFRLRFASLGELAEGEKLRRFLLVASRYGLVVPPIVRSTILDECPDEAIVNGLLDRRFMRVLRDGSLEWYHENLLHFFDRYLKEEGLVGEYAELILMRPALYLGLGRLERGRLAADAKWFEVGRECFDEIIEAIGQADNLSSVELDSGYFPYLDAVFTVLRGSGADGTLLVKALLAKAYLGNHNLPLLQGADACKEARAALPSITIDPVRRRAIDASLAQMEAHAHMNIGWLSLARKTMLELEARIALDADLQAQHDLCFDLFNRLQDLYRQYNHLTLAESYGKLAERAALAAANPRMLAVHHIGTAVIYAHSDLDRCLRLSREALAFARAEGTPRHVCFAELGLLAAQLARQREDSQELERIGEAASRLLRECLTHNWTTGIPRCYLLLAATRYLLAGSSHADLSRALRLADFGLDASVKYGMGHTVWQLHNLRAICLARGGARQHDVFKEFRTAIEHLRSEDLLFLGCFDLTGPSMLVVSNFVSFLDRHDREEVVYAFLDGLGSYHEHRLRGVDAGRRLVEDVRASGVITRRVRPPGLIYDEPTGYNLVVF